MKLHDRMLYFLPNNPAPHAAIVSELADVPGVCHLTVFDRPSTYPAHPVFTKRYVIVADGPPVGPSFGECCIEVTPPPAPVPLTPPSKPAKFREQGSARNAR